MSLLILPRSPQWLRICSAKEWRGRAAGRGSVHGLVEMAVDLLDVLKNHSETKQTDGAMTTIDIIKETGWPETRVRKMIGQKLDAGEIEVVFERRQNRVGYWHTVPAYKVKDEL